RTWNVTDACGNAATAVFRTVTWTVDTEKPVITATGTPANGTLGCNPTAALITAALGTATATDNCGVVTPTFTDGAVVSNGCSRSQTRTWNVTDACGNAATAVSRTATWTVDTEKPVITVTGTPANCTLACNPTAAAITAALGTATATDNCGSVSPTFTDATVVITGCLRSQTRTWNVTDACGNAAAPVSRTATWTVDVTPPTLTCPAGQTVECGAIPVFGTPTVSDGCGPNAIINDLGITTTNNADGSVTHTKTWTATDACGNTSVSCSQSIIVPACNEGCTLGYWKNHTDRWCSTYSPSMLFGSVFVNAPSNLANLTLLQALNLGGGGIYNLARQGVAALLNACSNEVDYPAPYLNNPQSVINAVNAAYLSGGSAPGTLATQLDNLNNSGCPLGGTSATKKEVDGLGDKAGFDAYPVPFKDQLTIRYNFDYVSDVKIDVLNSQGVSVLSKMDSNSYLNKEVTLNLNSHVDRSEVYIVKVTTNRGSSVKKVISSK
ncbi:T9SS type A sorting domain-containing protein, partial [Flavobacterium sp. RSP29]|uniref:T9SS type A sorting domain-containing protein n=1 Tax=Flavobacterium sp. RSP29 TaxID=3401731 RepID=UPI003AAA7995